MSNNTQRAVLRIKDYLRDGGTLMKMHSIEHGRRWYILPSNKSKRQAPAREVADHIAELLIREADVFPSRDGIWPGCDQTYKMGDGGNEPEEQRIRSSQK